MLAGVVRAAAPAVHLRNSLITRGLRVVRYTGTGIVARAATTPTATPTLEGPAYRANIDFRFIRDNVDLVKANCEARKASKYYFII